MIRSEIVAVVCTNPHKVTNSATMVYVAENQSELTEVSLLIAKITRGMVHSLSDEVNIIVIH